MHINWDKVALIIFGVVIIANLSAIDFKLMQNMKIPQAAVQTTQLPSEPPTKSPTATPITIIKTVEVAAPSSAQEFFIPFGSGSTQNDQWEDISGVEAFIDTNNYQNIQTIYFETSMNIPTKNGIVWARLYNVTDKHPVWNSEVSTDQDKSTFVARQIKLDSGNKQYRVQMKTTLKYESLLNLARVKIITK